MVRHNGSVPHTAYLSLGSNLGDRKANLQEAIARLREVGIVARVSSYYETEPVEFTAQPWFVNCVVELQTDLGPVPLMQKLLSIERAMGRERNQPKGPRNIDIDLVLFDNETINTPGLTLPHPGMHMRRFVLAPLAEIAPDACHPLMRKTASQLLESLPSHEQVRRLSPANE